MDYAALSPDDLVRICLASGDESAWAEFIRRFQPLIAGVVLRVCRKWGEDAPQTVDDLIQETYLKLCADQARLRTFESAHPDAIYGYLKVFTANLVHDHFKAVSSQKRGRNVTSTLRDDLNTQESRRHSEVEVIERSILISQIDTALSAPETGTNSQRDRRIFWEFKLSATNPASRIAGNSHLHPLTAYLEHLELVLFHGGEEGFASVLRSRVHGSSISPDRHQIVGFCLAVK